MARSRRMELLARLPATWRARFLQLGFNWHPAFRATGGRVHKVSANLQHIVVRLPLRRRTRNINALYLAAPCLPLQTACTPPCFWLGCNAM